MPGAARRAGLTGLTAEQQVLCLGARTVVDMEADRALRRLLSGRIDWDRLWSLGTLHDAIPLLERSLPTRAGDAMPTDWLARARRRRHATLRRNGLLSDALGAILSSLADGGVEAMPVKGTVLAEMLYDDLGLRPAADVDVLVRPADAPAARAIVAGFGYVQGSEPTFTTLVHEFHDPPYYLGSGPDQVCLELHRGLWATRFFPLGVEGLWERAIPAVVSGVDARVLSAEDTLLHLAIHRSRSALRLRWVCDIAELVRRHGETLDWDDLLVRAQAAGAKTSLYVVLKLSGELLGAPPPPSVLSRLRPGRLKRLLLERTCGARAMFRDAAPDDLTQQPHLTLRVFEQDGTSQIAHALGSSVRRSMRKLLHESGIARIGSGTT
jgi:Uncharacterised nucleotidyltransferase